MCSVKESISNCKAKKGDIVKAIIVRTKESIERYDDNRISFDDNACVLTIIMELLLEQAFLGL